MLIFYLIAFGKKVDLFSIFLLLIPVIALRTNTTIIGGEEIINDGFTWFKLYLPYLESIIMIGPIAVSAKLFGALGAMVRVFKNFSRKGSLLNIFWVSSLFLTIIGLYMSFTSGIESAGGLTVGLRIVLSIGVLLLPTIVSKENFIQEIRQIVFLSSILFILGVLNEHWIFVFVGLLPMLFFHESKLGLKALSLLCMIILLLFDFTFTVKISLILSIAFNFLIVNDFKIITRVSKNPFFLFFIISFPLLIVLLSVRGDLNDIFTTLNLEKISFKFFEDRVPIWTQTIDFVAKSNPFVVPAGRDIIVFDYGILGESNWGAGAHNIYLEMARQIGFLSSVLLMIIIVYYLFITFKKLDQFSLFTKGLIYSLIAVYMIYGLTGNSLVYDGVGFLFWLIIGQANSFYISRR